MRDKTNKTKKGQTLMNTMKKEKVKKVKLNIDGVEYNATKTVIKHNSNEDAMKSISIKFHKDYGLPLDYVHTTFVDEVLTSWYLKDNKVVRVNPQSKTIQ